MDGIRKIFRSPSWKWKHYRTPFITGVILFSLGFALLVHTTLHDPATIMANLELLDLSTAETRSGLIKFKVTPEDITVPGEDFLFLPFEYSSLYSGADLFCYHVTESHEVLVNPYGPAYARQITQSDARIVPTFNAGEIEIFTQEAGLYWQYAQNDSLTEGMSEGDQTWTASWTAFSDLGDLIIVGEKTGNRISSGELFLVSNYPEDSIGFEMEITRLLLLCIGGLLLCTSYISFSYPALPESHKTGPEETIRFFTVLLSSMAVPSILLWLLTTLLLYWPLFLLLFVGTFAWILVASVRNRVPG